MSLFERALNRALAIGAAAYIVLLITALGYALVWCL